MHDKDEYTRKRYRLEKFILYKLAESCDNPLKSVIQLLPSLKAVTVSLNPLPEIKSVLLTNLITRNLPEVEI